MKPTTILISVVVLMTFVLLDTEAAPNPEPRRHRPGKLKRIGQISSIVSNLLDAGASAASIADSVKGQRRFYATNYNDIYPNFEQLHPKLQAVNTLEAPLVLQISNKK
ncbi:hypothetical protein K1T71_001279 [Dendrolimus kikuchii]|uniref:Uncharacterized protein n=1 Tax=Dendrolimus kikuchii TaxID=765133 RepID=A0ACC1DH51_9NEOP|nr:hypothetical protein K1T71_001279 [Dendrolimus kikuchii]